MNCSRFRRRLRRTRPHEDGPRSRLLQDARIGCSRASLMGAFGPAIDRLEHLFRNRYRIPVLFWDESLCRCASGACESRSRYLRPLPCAVSFPGRSGVRSNDGSRAGSFAVALKNFKLRNAASCTSRSRTLPARLRIFPSIFNSFFRLRSSLGESSPSRRSEAGECPGGNVLCILRCAVSRKAICCGSCAKLLKNR